jgi:hypothetical protein
MRKPRTFKQLQNDPRVSDWSDERNPEHLHGGLWVYLSPGWVTAFEGLLTVHEDTVSECCAEVACAVYDPAAWADALDPMRKCRNGVALLPAG